MKRFTSIAVLFILSFTMAATASFAQKPVVNYLGVAGPLVFDKQALGLSWSSHPADNFYKQEYIVKGDDADNYKTMLLTDVVTGDADIKAVVGAKLSELKKAKETNPMVNYEIINNSKTGEYMIDFLVSANNADGSISILERNVYRYRTFTDDGGHKGVQLFGVSVRSYGAATGQFLAALKMNRKALISKVALYKMPVISIKK